MLKKTINTFVPPSGWRFPVIIILGIFAGLFSYAFYVSNAHSYISDKPETCVNCHIMAPQYATWSHSSHREVTHCNDCHVPHNNVFNKYYFKAQDGIRHASIFTMRNEPQVIFIREAGRDVVHQNCIRCHEDQITDARMNAMIENYKSKTQDRVCWDCHQEVPHGTVNSLSSVPYARIPLPESPVPLWLKNAIKKVK